MAEDVRIWNRPEPRWMGGFIVVKWSGEWDFYRCCNCHRKLWNRESRDRGYGPECAKLDGIEQIVRDQMTRDRIRMRLDLAARRARQRRLDAAS